MYEMDKYTFRRIMNNLLAFIFLTFINYNATLIHTNLQGTLPIGLYSLGPSYVGIPVIKLDLSFVQVT